MKALPPVSPATWRQRYEALRQHILARPPLLSAEPLGLVVVFTQGVAGWMQSWQGAAEPSSPPVRSLPPHGLSAPSWQQQLTHLLAQMTAPYL